MSRGSESVLKELLEACCKNGAKSSLPNRHETPKSGANSNRAPKTSGLFQTTVGRARTLCASEPKYAIVTTNNNALQLYGNHAMKNTTTNQRFLSKQKRVLESTGNVF